MPPDITAETPAVGAGCARGSQECNGASPALAPTPSNSSAKARPPAGKNTAGIKHAAENKATPA